MGGIFVCGVAVDDLPSNITISTHVYTVTVKKLRNSLAGRIHYRKGEIAIYPAMPVSRERETLLHEVLHGIIQAVGSKYALEENGDECEAIIKAISPTLLDTLRRNPDLTAYLLGGDA
jgi:hypothetical protein